jgi:integrase
MTIRKESDGTFTVWHSQRHPVTRAPRMLRRTKIKSLVEAKRVERELYLSLEHKFLKNSGQLWWQVVEEFLEYNKGTNWTLKTHENYETALKAHTFKCWSKLPIRDIKSIQIRDLLLKELAYLSESTRKSMWKYLNGVFTYALDRDYVQSNPVPKMKFRIGDKIEAVLNEEQIKLLLMRAKDSGIEWYSVWAAAIFTGMRNGELYALKWSSVDLKSRRIFVRETWSNKEGFKEYPKNRQHRVLEIPPPLIPIIQDLYLRKECEFVLPRIEKWTRGEQARELQIFLLALGLPKIRFHDLRGTYCTLMLNRGVEPAKLMQMAGWQDLKTMARYLRKAGISFKGSTDILEGFLDN